MILSNDERQFLEILSKENYDCSFDAWCEAFNREFGDFDCPPEKACCSKLLTQNCGKD